MSRKWQKAQQWELEWHESCTNSLNEELKQFAYAKKMGLRITPNVKTPYNIEVDAIKILDMGAGPYSLLLKTKGFDEAYALDPLMMDFPTWVSGRYQQSHIYTYSAKGENLPDFFDKVMDETWIYNCLQHTEDPQKVIKNALAVSKIVRIFEWLEVPENIGHLHVLTEEKLNNWLGGEGKVDFINEGGAVGKYYAGVFKGKHYEES